MWLKSFKVILKLHLKTDCAIHTLTILVNLLQRNWFFYLFSFLEIHEWKIKDDGFFIFIIWLIILTIFFFCWLSGAWMMLSDTKNDSFYHKLYSVYSIIYSHTFLFFPHFFKKKLDFYLYFFFFFFNFLHGVTSSQF